MIEYWGSGRETTDGVVGLEALAESVVGSGPGRCCGARRRNCSWNSRSSSGSPSRTLGLGILDGFDFLGVVDGTVPPIGKLFEIFFPYKAFFRSILSRLINDLSERIWLLSNKNFNTHYLHSKLVLIYFGSLHPKIIGFLIYLCSDVFPESVCSSFWNCMVLNIFYARQ